MPENDSFFNCHRNDWALYPLIYSGLALLTPLLEGISSSLLNTTQPEANTKSSSFVSMIWLEGRSIKDMSFSRKNTRIQHKRPNPIKAAEYRIKYRGPLSPEPMRTPAIYALLPSMILPSTA